jgi:hypothetical protein
MHTTSMNVTIHSALTSARSVERLVAPKSANFPRFLKVILGFFAKPRLDKSAVILADACHKLKVSALAIQRSTEEEIVDPDLKLRDNLQTMKDKIRKNRDSLRSTFSELNFLGAEMPEFYRSITTVVSLMGELYELATELQWAIAEHDASYSRRLTGFVAADKGELEAMLQRISAGA